MFDKVALRNKLIADLEDALARAIRAQKSTQEGVTHEDARAESDKDMRATEASYVARGQAMRVEALESDLAKARAMKVRAFDGDAPIAVSAIVVVEVISSSAAAKNEPEERILFVAPAGGGMRLQVEDKVIRVVTPSSPLGESLVGRTVGDSVRVSTGRDEELEITSIE